MRNSLRLWLALPLAIASPAMASDRESTEQPTYALVMTDGPYSVREYGPLLVAETVHEGERARALNSGFQRLADYIFGRDRPGAREGVESRAPIAMTSPVLQDETSPIAMTSPVLQDVKNEGAWRTRFIMPSKYTVETLPQAPGDIRISKLPARRVAAVRFAGYSSSSNLSIAEKALTEWIARNDLVPAGRAEFAFYDSPAVPPPMRRTEVLIPLEVE